MLGCAVRQATIALNIDDVTHNIGQRNYCFYTNTAKKSLVPQGYAICNLLVMSHAMHHK
jgi:hypothetical protein